MPDLFKPLFNSNLLKSRTAQVAPAFTAEQTRVLGNWIRTAADPAFRTENEKPFQGQFLTDIFGCLLRYVLPIGHLDAYHLKAESASSETKGGKTPDGRLGFFGTERDTTRVVIELKAPGADLDAKQPGHGNLTPVEQAFGYLAKFDDCRWVIVSNFVTLRLYSKNRGQGYAHEFAFADLAKPEVLHLFHFLLGRERLMAEPPALSLVDTLLADSCNREQEITREFYGLFSAVRLHLFQHLCDANPPPTDAEPGAHKIQLLAKAQKILDRILFVCFCEDTGLLPHGVIRQAFAAAGTGFVATSRWQQLCGLFHAVDKGNSTLKISGYNGGLFRADSALDALAVDDNVLDGCLRLAEYDFATEVNVNILGHIFEQSVADLEIIRAQIAGQKVDARKSQRKLSGIFYTPEFITQYIVSETIGTYLRQRFDALQARYQPEAARTPAKQQAARIALWQEYQTVLRHLRVLDLACGSGAFLVAAFDYLRAEHVRTNEHLADLRGGQPELFDLDREILTHNLFGVDICPESVEITKLALWLKTARPGKPLNDLDSTIRCGNSIVSPHPELSAELGRQAFDWRAQFAEVFGVESDTGILPVAVGMTGRMPVSPAGTGKMPVSPAGAGFDCVIGNPPYIRQEWLSPCKPAFEREFRCYAGTADAYLYFIERGLDLLRPGGRLGFITSGTFANANFAAPFRQWLPRVARFASLVNFGENQPFEDAEMVFPTISILEKLKAAVSDTGILPVPASDAGFQPVPESDAGFQPVPASDAGFQPAAPHRDAGFQPADSSTAKMPVSPAFVAFSGLEDIDIRRRNLPHWEQPGRSYYVTFRLADSLPQDKLAELHAAEDQWRQVHPEPWSQEDWDEYDKLFPAKIHQWLDAGYGACVLNRPDISGILEAALRHFDGERYILDEFVIMPNHVHVIVKPADSHRLSQILHSWKSFTSTKINKTLDGSGTLWMDERYDRILRSWQQLEFIRDYIRQNPANAGIAEDRFRQGRGTTGLHLAPDGDTGFQPVALGKAGRMPASPSHRRTGGQPHSDAGFQPAQPTGRMPVSLYPPTPDGGTAEVRELPESDAGFQPAQPTGRMPVSPSHHQPHSDTGFQPVDSSTGRMPVSRSSFRSYFMRGGIPDSIPDAVACDGIDCDDSVYSHAEWRFQPAAVTALFDRIMATGRPLDEVVEGRIYRGVLTGLNDAFIVDQATRDRLVAADAGCTPLLRKMLRGEDLRPWYQEDEGRWLITMPCGFTRARSNLREEEPAWQWLTAIHPSLASHLLPFAESARKRSDQGDFWWELRSCDYYSAFDQPKIFWPDIAKLPRFSWDEGGAYANNKGYLIAEPDPAILAILQSRVSWFCISQICTPLRLRGGLWQFQPFKQFVERLRIPELDADTRALLADLATRATAIARDRYALHGQVRHRLLTDFALPTVTQASSLCPAAGRMPASLAKVTQASSLCHDRQDACLTLNTRLAEWWTLDFAAFRSELRKSLKAEIPVKERQQWEEALAGWRGQHDTLTARLTAIEQEIDDHVCRLFNLSDADRRLLADHARHAMIDYPYGAV